MEGPFSLDAYTINRVITLTRPGVYELTDRMQVVRYAGRSDTNLRTRLLSHVGEGYYHFYAEYASSPKAAFERECQLYHYYYKQLYNVSHPARPEGTLWKCPYCNIFGY
jgi:hypothetical protein